MRIGNGNFSVEHMHINSHSSHSFIAMYPVVTKQWLNNCSLLSNPFDYKSAETCSEYSITFFSSLVGIRFSGKWIKEQERIACKNWRKNGITTKRKKFYSFHKNWCVQRVLWESGNFSIKFNLDGDKCRSVWVLLLGQQRNVHRNDFLLLPLNQWSCNLLASSFLSITLEGYRCVRICTLCRVGWNGRRCFLFIRIPYTIHVYTRMFVCAI